jgi:hypothetical protein
MEGGNQRDLFADALDEAAVLLSEPRLAAVAGDFRQVHALWHDLAEAALPADVPEFARIRDLTAAIKQSVMEEGSAGVERTAETAATLWRVRAAADESFPGGDATELLADLGKRVGVIYEAERSAIGRLAALTG